MERDRREAPLGSHRDTFELRDGMQSSSRGPERDHRRRERRRSRSPAPGSGQDDHSERRKRRSRSRDDDKNESREHGVGHRRRERGEIEGRHSSRTEGRFLDKSRFGERADRSRSSSSRVDHPKSVQLDKKRSSGSPRPHHHKHRSSACTPRPDLPFEARALSRHDYGAFKAFFAHYLDLQKGLRFGELGEDERRGRWKSFIGKWNRGELAEGWYDPEMFARVTSEGNVDGLLEGDRMKHEAGRKTPRDGCDEYGRDILPDRTLVGGNSRSKNAVASDSESEADDYGPPPPPLASASAHQQHGPGIPSMQDLEVRREMDAEDLAADVSDLRAARKADRKAQKEQLDELVPRAEAGTRERQLEKRAAVNEKMRGFRDKSPGGAEVPENELMGGGDGADEYRRMMATAQKRKSEREVRREEEARAIAAEREERIRAYKDKEDRTVEMLRELARQRFG